MSYFQQFDLPCFEEEYDILSFFYKIVLFVFSRNATIEGTFFSKILISIIFELKLSSAGCKQENVGGEPSHSGGCPMFDIPFPAVSVPVAPTKVCCLPQA